jgi:hypothetical protein
VLGSSTAIVHLSAEIGLRERVPGGSRGASELLAAIVAAAWFQLAPWAATLVLAPPGPGLWILGQPLAAVHLGALASLTLALPAGPGVRCVLFVGSLLLVPAAFEPQSLLGLREALDGGRLFEAFRPPEPPRAAAAWGLLSVAGLALARLLLPSRDPAGSRSS